MPASPHQLVSKSLGAALAERQAHPLRGFVAGWLRATRMEEDYTPQSPTVTVLRPSSSADFHLAEQALARGASSSKIQAAFRRHRERLLFRMLVFVVRRPG